MAEKMTFDNALARLGLQTLVSFLRVRNGKLPASLELLFNEEHFMDDTLDVSAMYPYAEPESCIIKFRRLPEDIRETGQLMGRVELFYGKAPATVQRHLDLLTVFFNELGTKRNYIDFRFIGIDDVRLVLDDGRRSPGVCRKTCTALKTLFSIAGNIYDSKMFAMDMDALEHLRADYARLANATRDASKTPDIDSEYFDELGTRLLRLAADPSVPINCRMTALFTLLAMWTGLRASELFSLTTDCHVTKSCSNGRTIDYIRYKAVKLQHGGRRQVLIDAYALPMAVAAYDMLMDLRRQVPGWKSSNRLFILDGPKSFRSSYKYYLQALFTKHLTDLSTAQWEVVKRHTLKGKTYYYPTTTQYRVHLCGWLYQQRVSMPVIELGMSHMTGSMYAYYVRMVDRTFAQQHRRADNAIRTRLNNDFSLEAEGYSEIGERLLKDFVLNYNMFKEARDRYNEMVAKGYDYEREQYGKKMINYIYSELRPALSYLDRVLERDGRDSVLRSHPALRLVIDNVDELINEFNTCAERISKK